MHCAARRCDLHIRDIRFPLRNMNMSFSTSWEAPPLEMLNISNCSAITPWLSYFVTGSTTESGWQLCPTLVGAQFAKSLIPDGWAQPTGVETVYFYTAMATGEYAIDNATSEALWDFALTQCDAQICPYLDVSKPFPHPPSPCPGSGFPLETYCSGPRKRNIRLTMGSGMVTRTLQ